MVYKESFKVRSNDKACTFHNVTGQARDIVERSGVKNGIAVVYSHHTTCCVITQECAFDMSMTGLETLQQDLVDVFEAIVPTCRREGQYLHPGPKPPFFHSGFIPFTGCGSRKGQGLPYENRFAAAVYRAV